MNKESIISAENFVILKIRRILSAKKRTRFFLARVGNKLDKEGILF